MKRFLCSALLLSTSCQSYALTTKQMHAIGIQIWQNESHKDINKLIFWHTYEPFPSLGIGHFIWYPAGTTDRFTQTFPDFINFLQHKKIKIPEWLASARIAGAPWPNRNTFIEQKKSSEMKELQDLLLKTVDLQAEFMIERLKKVKPTLLKNASPHKRTRVARHFEYLVKTPAGAYALVDYLNFKGDGLNPKERYKGQGWGLLQALEMMPVTTQPHTAVQDFARATEHLLEKRVHNAPNNLHEMRWLTGWRKRIATYPAFQEIAPVMH